MIGRSPRSRARRSLLSPPEKSSRVFPSSRAVGGGGADSLGESTSTSPSMSERVLARVEEGIESSGRVADENHGATQVRGSDERVHVLDVLLQRPAAAGPDVTAPDPGPVECAEANMSHLPADIGPGLGWHAEPVVCEHHGPGTAAGDPEPDVRLDADPFREGAGDASRTMRRAAGQKEDAERGASTLRIRFGHASHLTLVAVVLGSPILRRRAQPPPHCDRSDERRTCLWRNSAEIDSVDGRALG